METNFIELMNGTQLPCFPKAEEAEPADNSLNLDTTGEYFQVGRRKPTADRKEQDADAKAGEKLFCDNAFLFLANTDRILNDSRMFLAAVPIQSGLAYTGTGGFRSPTLGVYIEFWLNCSAATFIDKKGRKGMVVRISGSPLSGCNSCGVVFDDGTVESTSLNPFSSVWHPFMDINKRYDEAKATCESYTLQQVVDILKKEGEGSGNGYDADTIFYKKAFVYWKERCLHAEASCKGLRQELRIKRMEAVRDQLPKFVDEVKRRQEGVDDLSEQLNEARRAMKAKLRSEEISSAEFQRWWQSLQLRKDMDKAKASLEEFVHYSMKEIFGNGYNTLSFQDVRDFVRKQSPKQ